MNGTEQIESGIRQILERQQLPLRQLYLAAKLRVRLGRRPVSRGSRLLVCQVAHNHRESVESVRREGADFDLRLEHRPVNPHLPAAAASRGSSCLGEQPGKIHPARLVKQSGRLRAHHLVAFGTIQACRTGAPIADVARLVEEDHSRVFRRLVETAQRTVHAGRLTLG